MRVYFWLADWSGCGVYRCIIPGNMLTLRGHQVHYHNLLIEPDGSRFEPANWDVVVAQRTAVAGASEVLRALVESTDVKVLLEIDDLLTHVHKTNTSSSMFWSVADNKRRLIENLSIADGIVCSTPQLAQELGQYNRTFVFDNMLDESMVVDAHALRDEPTVGWAGSPSHRVDMDYVKYPLRTFFRRHPEVTFETIGWDYAKLLRITNSRHQPWSDSIPDYIRSLGFDVGIAPLAPNRFNRSKSHIKALEYAARGIPVVAADMEPYSDFVLHGETGFLVTSDREWIEALEALTLDATLREKMGNAAITHAKDYLIQTRIHEYEAILGEVLG